MAKKATKEATTTRRYHLVLTNGQERTIAAADVRVIDGALVFIDGPSSRTLVAYHDGAWQYAELETRDE